MSLLAFQMNRFPAVSGGASPVFQGITSFPTAAGTITQGWPTHATNDVLLAATVTRGDQPDLTDWATPGFTDLGNLGTGLSTTDRQVRLVWKRASSAAEPSYTMADSGAFNGISGLLIRGCKTSGAPLGLIAQGAAVGAANSVSLTGGSTVAANSLVAVVVAMDQDTDVSQLAAGGFTATGLTLTTQLASHSLFGIGGGLYIATAPKASAGAIVSLAMATVAAAPRTVYGVVEFLS